MKIKKSLLLIGLFVGAATLGFWWMPHINPPILQKIIDTDNLEGITLAEPLWGSQGLAVVFVDTQKFPARKLAKRVAASGLSVAVIDSWQVLNNFNFETNQCLDYQFVDKSIKALTKELPISAFIPGWLAEYLPSNAANRPIVTGISEGALLPFINAQGQNNATNLSIGFSIELPTDLALCPPLSTQNDNEKINLISDAGLKSKWRSVWTDQPTAETGVFIKSLGTVDTRIAAYDTPLDALLLDELNAAVGHSGDSSAPMPVVEVPVAKHSDTVTLFYSGDGGWRDLDRTIAGEMAALNYPVVGVDVLRYFWEHKTPKQAATDLTATMAYYRKHWGVKSFVLAGYSFGADILPAIYNRLPQQDKDSVPLLALIALANHADFEIHVSGWLGQSGAELPLAPELEQIPKNKILCVYGKEEIAETACTSLQNTEANILELPGGHHFDEDYPKLTRKILDVYQQHGIN